MTQSLDRIILSSKYDKYVSANKLVCEAYNCNKQATKQVTLTAGNLGDVLLNLCKKCAPKFTSSAAKNGDLIHSLPLGEKKGNNHEYIISTA